MLRTVAIVLLSIALWRGGARAEGELILPIPGPILRDVTPASAERLFCAAPPAFTAASHFVPAGTFAYLLDALVGGSIESRSWSAIRAATLSDDALLKSSVFLAKVRGLADGFAPAGNWRVVSIRADLCRGDFEGLDDASSPCEDQLRLVAQPFERTGMFVRSHDFALHLAYALPDRDAFLRARNRLDELAAVPGLAGAQQLLDSKQFSCDSRFRDEVFGLIRAFAQPERLRFISWVASSASGQQWTFGRFTVDAAGNLVPHNVTASGYFDNFSKPLLLSDHCPINSDASEPEKAAFRCPAAEAAGSAARMLSRFENPRDLRRPVTFCVACHSAGTLEAISRAHRVNDDLGLPVFKRNNVDPGNLRQFGYDLHGHRSVSQRLMRVRGE